MSAARGSNRDNLIRWQQKLERQVRLQSKNDDASHDLGHLRRVWRAAYHIAGQVEVPVDLMVLLAASYLHDIVSLEKNDPRRADASRLAANRAHDLLMRMSFPGSKLPGVMHAIEAHSFSGGISPRTIEARILQDADRLDALGALGVARVFYVSGRIGRMLFHDEDPRARSRARDDRKYALDHFYIKLFPIAGRMHTKPAKAIAKERVKRMREFVRALAGEVEFGRRNRRSAAQD